MNCIRKVSWAFISLNLLHQGCRKLQNHPYLTALQNSLEHGWKIMMHISQKGLKSTKRRAQVEMVNAKEGNPPFDCRNDESYIHHIFVILGALYFICVISWCIWNYRRSRKQNIKLSSKVTGDRFHSKDERSKLKNVHKILRTLNRQLIVAKTSKIPRLYSMLPGKDKTNPIRNRFSHKSICQDAEKKPSIEDIRQNILTAIQLLEGVIIDNKNIPSDSPINDDIDNSVTEFNNDEIPARNFQWNQENNPVEKRFRNTEEWTLNFRNNDETPFSENEIDGKKISPSINEEMYVGEPNNYLKQDLSPVLRPEKFCSYRSYSSKNDKNQKLSPKSLFSNVSHPPGSKRYPINEDLKENFTMASQFLEKGETDDKFARGEISNYNQEDDSIWSTNGDYINAENHKDITNTNTASSNYHEKKTNEDAQMRHLESNGFISIAENSCGRQNSVYNMKDTDSCRECQKKKIVSHFCNQIDSKDISARRSVKEPRGKRLYIRCSEKNELEYEAKSSNQNELLSPKRNSILGEFPKQTSKPTKMKDILNVSSSKNALNIAILFNRDIQLTKCT